MPCTEYLGPEIYQPSEDTFLLLKAALNEVRSSDEVLEIGCGSGLISLQLAPLAKRVIATDINPYAIKHVRSLGLECLRANLFFGIKARFDLVLFNPPYLPTSEGEKMDGWLNYSLDGGPDGRKTIYCFLRGVGAHLRPGGRALLLASSLTGIKEVVDMAKGLGLTPEELFRERYFFEDLVVLRITE